MSFTSNNNRNMKRRNCGSSSKRRSSSLIGAAAVAAVAVCGKVEGFAFTGSSIGSSTSSTSGERRNNALKMYVPSPSAAGTVVVPSGSGAQKTSVMAASTMYSESAPWVNPSDTLPAFHTSNGLLSPQTVKLLEQANTMDCGNPRNQAVGYFVDTYKGFGPMACLPILSDPDVLPELTRAMRDAQM